MRKLLLSFLLLGFLNAHGNAQKITQKDYIEKYKYLAVSEMHRVGIPASITIAQGILESEAGNSKLARKANNHFGIKCHSNWDSTYSFIKDDDTKDECFRKYETAMESFIDHSEFLRNRPRYAFLFDLHQTEYVKWAYGLKSAGYATNPNYSRLLINLIKKNDLEKLDYITKTQLEEYQVNFNVSTYLNKINEKTKTETNSTQNTNALTSEPEIEIINGLKSIVLNEVFLDISKIASQYNLSVKQLYKYNEIGPAFALNVGDRIFLEAKQKRAIAISHQVKRYENMWQIAQEHGIRLKDLYKKNLLPEGSEVAIGQTLQLQETATQAPLTQNRSDIENLKRQKNEREWRQKLLEQEAKAEARESKLKAEIAQLEKQLEKLQKGTPPTVDTTNLLSQDEIDAQRIRTAYNQKIKNLEEQKKNTPPKPKFHKVVKGDTLYNISQRYYITVDELKKLNGLKNNDIKLGMRLKVK